MRLLYLFSLIFFISTMLFSASPVLADEIIIVDADNVPRANAVVEKEGSVEFALETESGDPADGVEVILKNIETGEEIRRTSVAGIVMFYNIGPGIWEVTSAVNWVTFSGVTVSSGTIAAGSAAAVGAASAAGATGGVGLLAAPAVKSVLIGGAILGGTGTAIVVAENQRSSSSESPSASPTPTPDDGSGSDSKPTPTPTPSHGGGGGSRPITTPVPTPKPTPIEPSPFS